MFITPTDLEPFADIEAVKAAVMVEDAEAMAILAAPCLPDLISPATGETPADAAIREAKLAALRAILRGAILRWNEAGTGALQSRQDQVGPFGQMQTLDTRQTRKGMFWPSEIEQLQSLCSGARGGAFEVDTAGDAGQPGYWSAPDTWTPLTQVP